MTRVIDERQSEWKRHRWQKMNTKILRDETNRQMSVVRGLPDDVFTWDVYMGLIESITNIQVCPVSLSLWVIIGPKKPVAVAKRRQLGIRPYSRSIFCYCLKPPIFIPYSLDGLLIDFTYKFTIYF